MKKSEQGRCVCRGATFSGAELHALFMSIGLSRVADPTALEWSTSRQGSCAVDVETGFYLTRSSCKHKYLQTSCMHQGENVQTLHFCCYCNVVLSFSHKITSNSHTPHVQSHVERYVLKEFIREEDTDGQEFVFLLPTRSYTLPPYQERVLHVEFSKTSFSRLFAVLINDKHAEAVLKVKCISYAITLLNNILKDSNPKYRRVSGKNPALQKAFSIAADPSRGGGVGWRLLKCMGFTEYSSQPGECQFILYECNEDPIGIKNSLLELKYWKRAVTLQLQEELKKTTEGSCILIKALDEIKDMSNASVDALAFLTEGDKTNTVTKNNNRLSQREQLSLIRENKRKQHEKLAIRNRDYISSSFSYGSDSQSQILMNLTEAGRQLVSSLRDVTWVSRVFGRLQAAAKSTGFFNEASSGVLLEAGNNKKRKISDLDSYSKDYTSGILKQARLDKYGIITGVSYPMTPRIYEKGETNAGGPSASLPSRIAAVGLFNIANTCYLNSILQAYFWIPAFRQAVLTFDAKAARQCLNARRKAGKTDFDRVSNSINVAEETAKLFAVMSCGRRFASSPYALYVALLERNKTQMEANAQCDVAEFNALLLDNLREAFQVGSCNDKEDDPVESCEGNAIGKLFFGVQRTLSHPGTSERLMPPAPNGMIIELRSEVLALNLKSFPETGHTPIPGEIMFSEKDSTYADERGGNTLTDTLGHFCSWSSCTLAERGEHLRRTDFETLPSILTVHLPRVQWDQKRGCAAVDTTPVTFDQTLFMDPYVHIDAKIEDPKSLQGMLHQREIIAHRLSRLDINDSVQKITRFIEYAEEQTASDLDISNGSARLVEIPSELQNNVRALQSSVNATREMLLQQDAKLKQGIRKLLEENAMFRYRLHAIIMHSGHDGRPNAGHYFVHVRDIDDESHWVTFNDERVIRVRDPSQMMKEAYGLESHHGDKIREGNSTPKQYFHHCCARSLVYVRVPANQSCGNPFSKIVEFPRMMAPDDLHHLNDRHSKEVKNITVVDSQTSGALLSTIPESGARSALIKEVEARNAFLKSQADLV